MLSSSRHVDGRRVRQSRHLPISAPKECPPWEDLLVFAVLAMFVGERVPPGRLDPGPMRRLSECGRDAAVCHQFVENLLPRLRQKRCADESQATLQGYQSSMFQALEGFVKKAHKA
jgi:hypothetical protein